MGQETSRERSASTRPELSKAASEDRRDVPQAAEPPAMPKARDTDRRLDRIAIRAHEIYEARGGTHGRALQDWLDAEREIDALNDGE